jgi:hypothetical protein
MCFRWRLSYRDCHPEGGAKGAESRDPPTSPESLEFATLSRLRGSLDSLRSLGMTACGSFRERQRILRELLRVLEVLRRLLAIDDVPLDPVLLAQGVEALPQIAV